VLFKEDLDRRGGGEGKRVEGGGGGGGNLPGGGEGIEKTPPPPPPGGGGGAQKPHQPRTKGSKHPLLPRWFACQSIRQRDFLPTARGHDGQRVMNQDLKGRFKSRG